MFLKLITMKIKKHFIFDPQSRISIFVIPVFDLGFENYYKYYNLSVEIGWLCFGVFFEFKINKNNNGKTK